MAGPTAGLVRVENDPFQTSASDAFDEQAAHIMPLLSNVSARGRRASLRGSAHLHLGTTPMNSAVVGLSAMAALAMPSFVGNAFGQQESLAKQLLGTWTLLSHESVRPDGSRVPVYGADPKGVAFFDSSGHFIITVMRSDRAKYAIDLPTQGTPEENKGTAQGTITYFGTYSLSEADRTIAIHIEASSFPNWNGADQKRIVAITGDQLKLTARALQTGGHADVIWKRAK